MSYSGYWNGAGIYKVGTGNLILSNSTLQKTGGAGLRIREGSGVFTSENNRFNDNTYGIQLSANTSFSDTTSTFSSNTTAPVAVDASNHTSNVSWELSSDYSVVIIGSQTVAAGATLTLQPGLVLKSFQYKVLVVDGQLLAEGTVEAPIHFTSHQDDSVGGDANNDGDDTASSSGWWMGLQVQNEGAAILENSTISYGGYWNAANLYKVGTGELFIRHTLLRRSSAAGLRLLEGSESFLSEFNRFEENVDGVRLGLNTSFADTTSIFDSNTKSQVSADGGTHTTNVDWQLSSHYAIYLPGTHTVGVGTTLTLTPGFVIKVGQYKGLVVDGELHALGSAGSPITFTDYRDDTIGGDTNNNEALSMPAAGWWSDLQIRDGATAILENCILRYGGYWDRAGILKLGTSDLTLANSTVSMVNGSALYLSGTTGKVDLLRNRFTHSTNGVRVKDTTETITLNACQYEGNSDYGVLNNNSIDVDARNNWWGDASGPFHTTENPEGLGDAVSDGVLFEPWRTSPSFVDILSPTRSGTLVADDTLRFLGSMQEDSQVGYFWDFGDGRTSNVRNPGLLSWPTIGNFQVHYSVITDGVADPFPETREFDVVANDGMHPDLRVESFVLPASIGIGQSLTIDYTVKNLGPAATPANFSWTDRVYLSGDDIFDATDIPLSSKEIERVLGPGETYGESLVLTLPAVVEGAHYLIISANDDWDLVELHRLNNERPESVNVLVPQLQDGVAFVGSHGLGSTEQYFRVASVGGKHLLVNFDRIDPNLEVYIRFGELPTRGQFDYRLSESSLVIPAAASGDWYFMVYGDQLILEGNFSLKIAQVDVAVTGGSPNLADSDSALDLELFGAGFSSPLSVQLVASNDTRYSPATIAIDSFTSMTASLGASTLPPDTYDIRVEKNGNEFVLPDALELVSGGVPDFYVDINSPTPMGYHQLATIYVEYGNKGTAPMQAPMLLVTALQNNRPGALMTLDPSRLSAGFWTSAIPKGFSTSVRLIAGGEQPGVLMPGEERRILVYYAGWLKPWNFRYPPFEFKVVALTANDIRPVPWNLLEPTMKPPYIDEEPWSAIWENFRTAVGPSVGDLVNMLSRNAVYLSKIGSNVRDVESLLAFEFIKAKGLIGPLSELTGEVDLDVHHSFLTLQFVRSFPRNITQRYRLGPMGFGWNHGWEVRVDEQTDGTVILTRGNGAAQVYQPDSRGRSYFSGPGDRSQLTRSAAGHTLTLENGTRLFFDSSGLLERNEDRYGSTIVPQYSNGLLQRLTHTNGLEIVFTYNSENLISKVEDSIGNWVSYEYDENKHLVRAVHSQRGETQYTYSDAADLRKRHALTGIFQPGDVDQAFEYDSSGRLATMVNVLGSMNYTYHQGDISTTDDLGHSTRASFNHLGAMVRMVDTESGVTTIDRDEESRTTWIRTADGTAMKTVRDRNGHVIKRINQNGEIWNYETGSFGQITKVITPEGRVRSMQYDAAVDLIRLTEPDGRQTSFEYDSLGRVTKRTTPAGIIETTTFNAIGLATQKDYSDGTSRTFEYDEKYRLIKATNEEGDTSFSYDTVGNLTRLRYPNNLYIEYEYDLVGQVTAALDQNGRGSRYAYNRVGLLNRLESADQSVLVDYVYDAAGRLAEKQLASGARTVYERNGRSQITRQITYDSGDSVLADFSADYNSSGLLSTYQTSQGTYNYSYDPVGRLQEMVYTPVAGVEEVHRYKRSPDGHLEKRTINGVETIFTIDSGGRMTAVDGVPIVYDDNGNVLTKGAGLDKIDYVYNALGRVAEFTAPSGTYQMGYDALGNPLGMDAPTMSIKYLFDGLGKGMIFGEYDADGDPVRTYNNGLGMAVVNYDGDSYFPEYDPINGEPILALPTTSESLLFSQPAMAGFKPQDFFPFDPPFDYGDVRIPLPGPFGWSLRGDGIEFISPQTRQAAQVVGFGVKDSYISRFLSHWSNGDTPEGGFLADIGYVGGLTGMFGGFNSVADGLARAANTVVVITEIPEPVLEGIEFLQEMDWEMSLEECPLFFLDLKL